MLLPFLLESQSFFLASNLQWDGGREGWGGGHSNQTYTSETGWQWNTWKPFLMLEAWKVTEGETNLPG